MVSVLIVLIVLFLAIKWLSILRYRLGYVHLVVLFLSFQVAGVSNNAQESGEGHFATLLIAASLVATLLGLSLYRAVAGPPLTERPQAAIGLAAQPELDGRIMMALAVVACSLTIYHYTVAGIPFFSARVEQARFEFAASGMLGIPSRVAHLGNLYIVLLTTIYLQLTYNSHRKTNRARNVILITSAVALLLSGFKSSLLILFETLLVCVPYSKTRTYRLSPMVFVTVGGLAAVAVVVVGWVLMPKGAGFFDVLDRLANRILVVSGKPFYFVVTSYVPKHGFSFGSGIWLDLQYLAGKLGVFREYTPYTSTSLVSAAMHGRDVWEHFTVPVTTTIFGWFYIEGGIMFCMMGALTLGVVIGWLYDRPCRGVNPVRRACWLYAQLTLFSIVTKGGVVYDLVNRCGALLLILTLFYTVSVVLRCIHLGSSKWMLSRRYLVVDRSAVIH